MSDTLLTHASSQCALKGVKRLRYMTWFQKMPLQPTFSPYDIM